MNILLSSAGRRSYIVTYFRELLNGDGKVFASNSEWSTALELADEGVITPLIYDESYIQFLLEYCKKKEISVLVSLFDIDLPVLAKAKAMFLKHGINVIVSDFNVTQICNDKWKTYKFLNNVDLNTPKSFISIQKAEEAIKEKVISFPLVVKPRWGMGSLSVFIAENMKELRVFYNKAMRQLEQSYLKYESQADYHQSIIIQEFLKGQEYGLDIINDLEGAYCNTIVKRKIGMRSGETDSAITERNGLLNSIGKKISMELGHIANLDTDCFILEDKAYVLEMNCRFGGGYPFSHIAGVNLPAAIIKWVKGEEIDQDLLDYAEGVEGRKDLNIIKIN